MDSYQNGFLYAGVADRVIRFLPLSPIYELFECIIVAWSWMPYACIFVKTKTKQIQIYIIKIPEYKT